MGGPAWQAVPCRAQRFRTFQGTRSNAREGRADEWAAIHAQENIMSRQSILVIFAVAALGASCLVPADASARGGRGGGGFHGGGFHGGRGFHGGGGRDFHGGGGRGFHGGGGYGQRGPTNLHETNLHDESKRRRP